jgi:hypothetical protein
MEPFLMSKAVDFSATAMGKAVSVVVKGLIVLGIIALIVWSCYVTFVKPHLNPTPTTTVQSGGISNSYQIKVGFGGCMRLPVKAEKK